MSKCLAAKLDRAVNYARQGVRSGVLDNLSGAADKARENGARGLANALLAYRDRADAGEDIAADLAAFVAEVKPRVRR